MYLLDLHYDNAKANGHGGFSFRTRQGIPKWTVLGSRRTDRELIRLMALACGGVPFVSRLSVEALTLHANQARPLDLEFVMARHVPHDGVSRLAPFAGSGLRIGPQAIVAQLSRGEWIRLPSDLPVRQPTLANGNGAYFLLAYGPRLTPKKREDFDFEDPFHRVSRFHALFDADAGVTDPAAFLARLHYKAVLKSRFPAKQTMRRMTGLLEQHIGIDTSGWWEKACRFEDQWHRLPAWQRRIALPIVDAVRHAIDASPRMGHPLTTPGVVILDRPDLFCPDHIFAAYVRLFDALLPAMQFVVTLSPRSGRRFPWSLRRKHLPLPGMAFPEKEKQRKTSPPPGSVLLIDVDGRLPNVALMKLSRHFKLQGRRVHLARRELFGSSAHEVWASCVFHRPASLRRVSRLRAHYGSSLQVAGSGIDLKRRLPSEVENLQADYSLYPELGDRTIGFLTRGCPGSCLFCVVPVKEGKPRQVADLDTLLQGRKKLILLDDNILAHSKATEFLEDMVRRDVEVNFNQTLDIHLLDDEKAALLRRIRCRDVGFKRSNYHFSLNDTRRLDGVRRRYARLGFRARDNVEFICMYGYNTTLAQDVERFRFLRSLPGAYVFVQRYQPFPGAPRPKLDNFFDENVDDLLDELVRIVFTQNMKSMEVYYRWVSKEYVLAFGKLHRGLVDTIFRYNNRHSKGRYLATLANTRRIAQTHI